MARLARRHGRGAIAFSATAERALLAHAWPGNIRELAHEIERALIFCAEDTVELATLSAPAEAPGTTADSPWLNPAWRLPENGFALDDAIEVFVREALRETGDNVSAAARRLGVTREFLRYRLAARGSSQPPAGA